MLFVPPRSEFHTFANIASFQVLKNTVEAHYTNIVNSSITEALTLQQDRSTPRSKNLEDSFGSLLM
jgi:hypothetical protein